jgi:HEPN domain-containing protein
MDWLSQARNDLEYARAAFRDGFFAQVCFISQQSSEKALKSILYFNGAKAVLSHSLHRLCKELGLNDDLMACAQTLDQYYVTARYPDALVEGAPHDVFTKKQAEEAIGMAERFLGKAQGKVK